MASAMRQIQTDYAAALLREGSLLLGDRQRALDALQDTLVRAWKHCASFEARSELFPWLKRILRNLAVDTLRREPDTEPLDGESAQVQAALAEAGMGRLPSPHEALFDAEVEQVYRACAQRFADEHPLAAHVIRWLVEDELTHEELARTLGRSPGATREYLSQCRKKARVYFAPLYAALREADDDNAARGARRRVQGLR